LWTFVSGWNGLQARIQKLNRTIDLWRASRHDEHHNDKQNVPCAVHISFLLENEFGFAKQQKG
jgi:hypothetical protein